MGHLSSAPRWFSLLDLLLPACAVGAWCRPGAAVVVSAGALLLQSCLEPHPRHCQRCFHPFLLCFFQLLWSPLGTAGTVSSMHPISHLSQSRGWEAHVVRGHSLLRPLVPPWQGSEGQMPAEHFIQRQVMLHWRNPPLTPSLMSIQWQSPKTPPALEPEPCC